MLKVVQKEKTKKISKNKKNKTMHPRPSFGWKNAIVWILLLLVLVFLIGNYIYKNYYHNYNYIKEDHSRYLVYTADTSINKEGKYNEAPYVNIDSEDAERVNEEIRGYADQFLRNQEYFMVYDFQVNGKVLSLVIQISKYDENGDSFEVIYYTYNFNLDTRRLMDNDEILDLFHVKEKDVRKKIKKQFRTYYKEEVEQEYLNEEECDYQCFLSLRQVDSYMDFVQYYIKNGNLIAYRPFTVFSDYEEEEYFTEKSFEFYIAG